MFEGEFLEFNYIKILEASSVLVQTLGIKGVI